MKEIIAARMPVKNRDAILTVLYEDGRPAEIYIESPETISDLGWTYLGKVETIDPRLQAAFVRIRKDRRVYLPLTKEHAGLKAGDEIAVQIIQEAQKTKLPKGTTFCEAAGDYLVLSTEKPGLSFSRKLSAEERKRLKDCLGTAGKTSGRAEEGFHVLFRTRAAEADAEILQQEYSMLKKELEEVCLRAATRSCYSVLRKAPCLQERLIRRCREGELSRFVTDERKIWEELSAEKNIPADLLQYYSDPQIALFRLHDLSALLDRALAKEVHLKSGGTLIIEQTEAFTAIDVNSARFSRQKKASDVRRLINREAAAEAARQIRLRHLSGTILIDFINPDDPAEEKELSTILREAVSKDPVQTTFVDFTRLHICEITRKKRVRPLREQVRALVEEYEPNDSL